MGATQNPNELPSTFASDKTRAGNFFEDFRIGMRIRHATPRTLSEGDRSLYIGLTGSRDVVASAQTASEMVGLDRHPLDPIFVFNVAFGKTVPDISLNAIANLGYADVRFLAPVHSGDTLRVESEIIGLNETSTRKSGVVYTRSTAYDQFAVPVLTWVRWVLVHKRDHRFEFNPDTVPTFPATVDAESLVVPNYGPGVARIASMTGSEDYWEDYRPGEQIRHLSGMTINDSDHSIATRLYQNTAKAHFDAELMLSTPAGRRLVYGGHVISVCRALSYDGLENVVGLLAINAGTHVAPTYAGDTLRCVTMVEERIPLKHPLVGALRLRAVAAKNITASSAIVIPTESGKHAQYSSGIVLDLNYTVVIPKRPA